MGRRLATAFTEACNATTATPTSRSIRIRIRWRRWSARPATRMRRQGLGRQRACGLEGASVHELPRGRAHDFSKDRSAVGGVSAECAEDLRQLPRHRGDGEEARAGERVSAVHGLDSRLRAEQGRAAGGGQLPELPRIASHPEPHGSGEPDVQGEHSEDLRKLPREDQRRLHGTACTARPWRRAT